MEVKWQDNGAESAERKKGIEICCMGALHIKKMGFCALPLSAAAENVLINDDLEQGAGEWILWAGRSPGGLSTSGLAAQKCIYRKHKWQGLSQKVEAPEILNPQAPPPRLGKGTRELSMDATDNLLPCGRCRFRLPVRESPPAPPRAGRGIPNSENAVSVRAPGPAEWHLL